MSVRVGLALPATGVDLGAFVDESERLGFDSLWVTERVNAATHDPIVAMTWAAARTSRMKIGASVMVLPGRQPALLAKALASLDVLSGGRLLPAFGLGLPAREEHQAFGVEAGDRAAIFEEALPLLRRLWAEDEVVHHGQWFTYDRARIDPKPVKRGFPVWMGGVTPRELDRVGRLADGWLAAFIGPARVEAAIATIVEATDRAGRSIDDDHYGSTIVYHPDPDLPAEAKAAVARLEPDTDPRELVATSPEALEAILRRYVDVGASKFVVAPQGPHADWIGELTTLAQVTRSVESWANA